MRRLLTLFPLLLAVVVLVTLPEEAEAKRLGYGKSMGRQYSLPQKPTPPAAAPGQAAGEKAAAPAPRSGAGRWLGPLAGLLAGGLLASLFFGDAFDGFQAMDLVILAALLFGVVMLFRALRPKERLRTAAGPAVAEETLRDNSTPAAVGAPLTSAPSWFDAAGFVAGARSHYLRLQAAWDRGDMKEIAEYTTPELFGELQAERVAGGEERHTTEVLRVEADLIDLRREGDQVVASIRFSALVREEQGALEENVVEIWHVLHEWATPEGDWRVAGIQQGW